MLVSSSKVKYCMINTLAPITKIVCRCFLEVCRLFFMPPVKNSGLLSSTNTKTMSDQNTMVASALPRITDFLRNIVPMENKRIDRNLACTPLSFNRFKVRLVCKSPVVGVNKVAASNNHQNSNNTLQTRHFI
jgi:hypothetical protein